MGLTAKEAGGFRQNPRQDLYIQGQLQDLVGYSLVRFMLAVCECEDYQDVPKSA